MISQLPLGQYIDILPVKDMKNDEKILYLFLKLVNHMHLHSSNYNETENLKRF